MRILYETLSINHKKIFISYGVSNIEFVCFLKVGVQAGRCSSEARSNWEHSPCISLLPGGPGVIHIAAFWPYFRE